MNTQNKIGLVFTLIILLLVGFGVISLSYSRIIASDLKNLYNHPYMVSNAARDIKISLISMHRNMKDVVLAENEQQIKQAILLVSHDEKKIQKRFKLIFERYLGEQGDIEAAYTAFADWKTLHDDVIFLKTRGRDKEAADITRNQGAEHVALLNNEAQKLIDFADNKAKVFLTGALESEQQGYMVQSALLVIIVLASIMSANHVVRRLKKAQEEIAKRMHLIDQNIQIAKYDNSGVVLDISSRLCRYLQMGKEEIIGKHPRYFIDEKLNSVQAEDVQKIIASGKSWEGEVCIARDKDDSRWIKSSLHPEFDEQYRITGYTNIVQDISDRKRLEELSITDPLTSLYNRRHFDEVFEKELKIVRRNLGYLSLAMIDIDYFKNYNDHYGHPAGDLVLKKVAAVISTCLKRPNDYAFRLGGEEFGLIFSDLDGDEALAFLDKLREQVMDLQIPHSESDACHFLSVSIGVHTYHAEESIDVFEFYNKADKALYQAKKQRNCVVVS